MVDRGSRDHLWLLAGAAVLVVGVAATATFQARGDDTPSTQPSVAESSSASPRPGATDTATPSPSVTDDPLPDGALLPNLGVLPADELGITGRAPRRALRFASVLTNSGTGPLQVSPVPDERCRAGQRYVEQRVYLDTDGSGAFHRERDRRTIALPGGCMVFHPGHDHWHFFASASYVLTAVSDEGPIVETDKVSFCLRDSEVLDGAMVRNRRAYDECARNRRQGITVGWGDRYRATLSGQRLPLPRGFVDGRYCLRLEVDPFGLLREENEDDNTSAIVVRIAGRQVSRVTSATC